MFETLDDLVYEELVAQIKDISQMQTGNEEKSKAIEDFVKLNKMAHDENNSDKEYCRTEEEHETALKEQKKERYVKVGIAAAELLVPMIFYGMWLRKGMKFEETGSFTSTTFKGLINRFRPTK